MLQAARFKSADAMLTPLLHNHEHHQQIITNPPRFVTVASSQSRHSRPPRLGPGRAPRARSQRLAAATSRHPPARPRGTARPLWPSRALPRLRRRSGTRRSRPSAAARTPARRRSRARSSSPDISQLGKAPTRSPGARPRTRSPLAPARASADRRQTPPSALPSAGRPAVGCPETSKLAS